MDVAKIFLGENLDTSSIDKTLFDKLFHVGMNNELFVIKTKIPIPHQDISNQHIHRNYELTVPLSHSPKLLIEKNLFTLPKKCIFPSNPGQYHGPAEVAHQHRLIALQLTPNLLQEIASLLSTGRNETVKFQNCPVPFDLNMDNLINMFIEETQNKQAGYEFILEHLSNLLGASILRTLKSNVHISDKKLSSVSKKEINRALEFFHANYNQDFSLADVAELVGLSKYHFIRVFKKETGKTPYQYYIDVKINKAIELIKTRKYSITEICFMCGFKDHSHFSRVFLNKTGTTPSHFKAHFN